MVMTSSASYSYSVGEMLVAATAREIRDFEVVMAGVGRPFLGALVALFTHAPHSVIMIEGGAVGSRPCRPMLGVGSAAISENALCTSSLWRVFADVQNGQCDVGIIGGAQVDKYGNVNSTTIFGEGSYYRPHVRLPGSGGANDIASSARRTIITIPLEKKRFVETVDYITSPGYLTGGDARRRAGLPGGGPDVIITDKAIFRFDPVTKEAYLESVHPGVTVEEVKNLVGWDLKIKHPVKQTEPPTLAQLEVIRVLDAARIFTDGEATSLEFEEYVEVLRKSFEILRKLYLRQGTESSVKRAQPSCEAV